jgi:hypothetical protein
MSFGSSGLISQCMGCTGTPKTKRDTCEPRAMEAAGKEPVKIEFPKKIRAQTNSKECKPRTELHIKWPHSDKRQPKYQAWHVVTLRD